MSNFDGWLYLLQVGELPVQKIPVRVCVGGTPLVMQPGRLLLPGYSPRQPQGTFQQPHSSRTQSQGWPALPQGSVTKLKSSFKHMTSPGAQALGTSMQPSRSVLQTDSQTSELQSHSQTPELQLRSQSSELQATTDLQQETEAVMAMDFGQLLANIKAERTFYVFNTSCMAIQLNWAFFRYCLMSSTFVNILRSQGLRCANMVRLATSLFAGFSVLYRHVVANNDTIAGKHSIAHCPGLACTLHGKVC